MKLKLLILLLCFAIISVAQHKKCSGCLQPCGNCLSLGLSRSDSVYILNLPSVQGADLKKDTSSVSKKDVANLKEENWNYVGDIATSLATLLGGMLSGFTDTHSIP